MKLTKNRTLIAILCIVLAAILCFGIVPAATKLFNKTETVYVLNRDVAKGVVITPEMLSEIELTKRDTLNIPYVSNPTDVVGKYAKNYLFEGVITSNMFTSVLEDIDYKLNSLANDEMAMSITVQSLAGGLSGKLQAGDIIKIISTDDITGKAVAYDELQYVEVLSETNSDGVIVADGESAETEENLPTTIIIKITDEAQAMRLMDCEKGTLHAVFVTRDAALAKTYLEQQKNALSSIPNAINKED